MKTDSIQIRRCTELQEFDRCVDLQLAVWGYSDGDIIPRRVFLVAHKIGGQIFGAFEGGRMVGFAMSLPGHRNGHAYLHSHMLAVLPEYRNYGLGRRLKLSQREEALHRGIDLIEWTFDPLEIKNAYLNIEKLGAIVRRYTPDFYGTSSSPLQGGLPTDRLHAEWWLRSRRVCEKLDDKAPEQTVINNVTENVTANDTNTATIIVPGGIYEWKQSDAGRPRALAVQAADRALFERYFSEGLAVIGFQRDTDGNGIFQLGKWDENWFY
jgi:predicted GNAT superfamily acetyltransferase